MPGKQINPNRMELLKLRRQLNTARRGHRLLKDKRDELMRQFLEIVVQNRQLRKQVEAQLADAAGQMMLARAAMEPHVLQTALLAGRDSLGISVDTRNITSVNVPVFVTSIDNFAALKRLPYGMAATSGELDQAVSAVNEAFAVMIKLAEVEKTAQLLADEIEKTRRRVNSLEYVLIPELQDSIRTISMKMEENERGNLVRLMKVKDMIVAQAIAKARQSEAERQAAGR